jgi:uncharacterized damage-inducible protein DinB
MDSPLADQVLETWRIHGRILLYTLDAIAPEAFGAPPPRKGRGFAQMFAHIHNVRLLWLKSAAPAALNGLAKIEKGDPLTPEGLRQALASSAAAVEGLLAASLASGGKVKGFRPHAAAFMGYLIAHEAYHQGEIGLALAEIGFPLDQKTAYGMWEWGVR